MSQDEKDLSLQLAPSLVTLPELIEFDTYRQTVEALAKALLADSAAPVYLLCGGDGGEAHYGLALCELVARSPRVVGVLVGYAGSANSAIWASCPTRLVGDFGHLLIHGCQGSAGGAKRDIELDLAIITYQTQVVAEIYARASNKPLVWWVERLADARQSSVLLQADHLLEYGMGERLNLDIFANGGESVVSLKKKSAGERTRSKSAKS